MDVTDIVVHTQTMVKYQEQAEIDTAKKAGKKVKRKSGRVVKLDKCKCFEGFKGKYCRKTKAAHKLLNTKYKAYMDRMNTLDQQQQVNVEVKLQVLVSVSEQSDDLDEDTVESAITMTESMTVDFSETTQDSGEEFNAITQILDASHKMDEQLDTQYQGSEDLDNTQKREKLKK